LEQVQKVDNPVNFGEQVQKEKAQNETHKEVALEERRWREQVAPHHTEIRNPKPCQP
jgi:hypothetical protein